MISLLGALTRPLAESQERSSNRHAAGPIRGEVLSIPSLDNWDNRGNFSRFEPHGTGKRIQARSAGVVYITKKSSQQIYFEENSRSAISVQKKKSANKKVAKRTEANNYTKDSSIEVVKSNIRSEKGQTVGKNQAKPILHSKTNVETKTNVSDKGRTRKLPQSPKSVNSSLSSSSAFKVKSKSEKLLSKHEGSGPKNTKSRQGRASNDGVGQNLPVPSIPRTIQFYAKPPWLSVRDISITRVLSEGVVQRRIGLSQNRSTEFLLYLENITEEGSRLENNSVSVRIRTCVDAISVSCKDWPRVMAYHLDRIIGLNRIVPTAGRYSTEMYSTSITEGVTETAVWFPADLPARQYDDDSLEATRYVKKKFWRFSDRQKWSLVDECAKNVEDERARMAAFLFLLQIKERQLQECFKYPANRSHAPKHQDANAHLSCRNTFWGSGMRLTGQTWCLPPIGIDVNTTDSFNYTMLESIERFPSDLIDVMRNSKLRQHLLQSLFVDRIYWEAQGSRKGIETILQVIDKRTKALYKWVKTKGLIPR